MNKQQRILGGLTMNEQKYLNVEMKVTFKIQIDEDEYDDFNKMDKEDLEEIANDYFFNEGGCHKANCDFEFRLD